MPRHVIDSNVHPTDKHLDRRAHPDRVPLDERGAARHQEVLDAHSQRASNNSLHPHGSNVEHPGNTDRKRFGGNVNGDGITDPVIKITSPHNNVGSSHMPHVRRHV